MNLNGQDVGPPLTTLLPFHPSIYNPTRHKVVTRSGKLVTLSWRWGDGTNRYPIRGTVEGFDACPFSWTIHGEYYPPMGESSMDLFITGKHTMTESKKCRCGPNEACSKCRDDKVIPWDYKAWLDNKNGYTIVNANGDLVTSLRESFQGNITGFVNGDLCSWDKDSGTSNMDTSVPDFDLHMIPKESQKAPKESPVPFDKAKWLANQDSYTITTRQGDVVTNLHELKPTGSLVGTLGSRVVKWWGNGKYLSGAHPHPNDLFMTLKESPETPMEKPAETPWDTKVLQWANDRNLLAGGTVDGQFKKLVEEFGELAAALARSNMEEAKDAIGDIDVVLTILAAMLGLTRDECREQAYNAIKDRKGRMCGGVFIKEEDEK